MAITFKELLNKALEEEAKEKARIEREEQRKRDEERAAKLAHNKNLVDQFRYNCPNLYQASDLIVEEDYENCSINIALKEESDRFHVSVRVMEPTNPLGSLMWLINDPTYYKSGAVTSPYCEQSVVKSINSYFSML